MKPIQLHLLSFWKPNSQNLEKIITITPHQISHLQWWLNPKIISKCRSFQLEETVLIITTDTSMTGYGGHLNNQTVQGNRDKTKRMLHINCLEMEGVFNFETSSVSSSKQNGFDQMRQYNCGTIYQQNGGTKSPCPSYQTWYL